MNNNIITTNQNAKQVLARTKSLLNITQRILETKNSFEASEMFCTYSILITNRSLVSKYRLVSKDSSTDFIIKQRYYKGFYLNKYFFRNEKDVFIYDSNFKLIKSIKNQSIYFIDEKSKNIITKSKNKTKIWDLITLKYKKAFISPRYKIYFSNEYMISIDDTNKVHLWEANTLQCLYQLEFKEGPGTKEGIRQIYLTNKDYIVSSQDDFTVFVTIGNLLTGTFVKTLLNKSIKNKGRNGYDECLQLIGVIQDRYAIVDFDNIYGESFYTLVDIETEEKIYYYDSKYAYVDDTKNYIISREHENGHLSNKIAVFNILTKEIFYFESADITNFWEVDYRNFRISSDGNKIITLNKNMNILIVDYRTKKIKTILDNEIIINFQVAKDNKTILAINDKYELIQIDYIQEKVIKVYKDLTLNLKNMYLCDISPEKKYIVIRESNRYRYSLWNLEDNTCEETDQSEIKFIVGSDTFIRNM